MNNGLKGSPLENGAMAKGHYSDSLSRKLDRILNDREYSDVEEAENISVQGNLEMQLSKLLDDTEDEVSSNAWSEGSSSSVEHFSARDFVGLGMFDGVSNSNLELSSNPVQPLGTELAAALDSPSQHSSDSEETVGEEDGSVLCVYNNSAELLKNGWVGSDNESSSGKAIEGKSGRQKRPSSAMYPSSSPSDSDCDEICITNPQPPKQYSVHMSSDSNNTLQSNEAENGHSNNSPNLPREEQPPTSQEITKDAPPVENNHSCESTAILVETKALSKQNGSPSNESPISEELLEQETTTNLLPLANPSTSSRKASISEEGEVNSGASVDSQENELELIKLQVCPITSSF